MLELSLPHPLHVRAFNGEPLNKNFCSDLSVQDKTAQCPGSPQKIQWDASLKRRKTVVEVFLFRGMRLFPSSQCALFPTPYLVSEEWSRGGGEKSAASGLLCQR